MNLPCKIHLDFKFHIAFDEVIANRYFLLIIKELDGGAFTIFHFFSFFIGPGSSFHLFISIVLQQCSSAFLYQIPVTVAIYHLISQLA
jgi:hypothetical protein